MKKFVITQKTGLRVNQSYVADTLETKIEKMMSSKEDIGQTSGLIYTERSAGVPASMNIRTDRWEIAVEAMDKVAGSYQARRENKPEAKAVEVKKGGDDGVTESSQGSAV